MLSKQIPFLSPIRLKYNFLFKTITKFNKKIVVNAEVKFIVNVKNILTEFKYWKLTTYLDITYDQTLIFYWASTKKCNIIKIRISVSMQLIFLLFLSRDGFIIYRMFL